MPPRLLPTPYPCQKYRVLSRGMAVVVFLLNHDEDGNTFIFVGISVGIYFFIIKNINL
jgi:hypothetical protein